jgi:3-hydroxy-9,10-secoandrosta-1,3,5(10)-triene-9,17-dione monooxygenase reductase component
VHEVSPDDARRLRGRLTSGVTIWTAGAGPDACGLTVASVIVTEGEPPHVLGTVGDLADLLDAVRDSGRFVVHVLAEADRHIAERFAGTVPVPGGAFRGLAVEQTAHGPVLTDIDTRAACRLVDESRRGYPVLLDGVVEAAVVGDLEAPLAYFRGRYRRLAEPPRTWEPAAPDSALPFT